MFLIFRVSLGFAVIVVSIMIMGISDHAFSGEQVRLPGCQPDKITFTLDAIDKDGKRNEVPIDYEFCVPDKKESLVAVAAIDPGINCSQGPSGRIGCQESEYLCLGTAREGIRVLCELSSLDFVKRIDQCFWE
jgi:hypothetical protein